MKKYIFLCDLGCDGIERELSFVAENETEARNICYHWMDEHTTPPSSLKGPFPSILSLIEAKNLSDEEERIAKFTWELPEIFEKIGRSKE